MCNSNLKKITQHHQQQRQQNTFLMLKKANEFGYIETKSKTLEINAINQKS